MTDQNSPPTGNLPPPSSEKLLNKNVEILYEFFVHICVGSLIFAGIAGAALLLGVALDKASNYCGAHEDVTYPLKFCKYAVLYADAALFLVYLTSSVIHFGKRLWKLH